jgi:hypothetical protein
VKEGDNRVSAGGILLWGISQYSCVVFNELGCVRSTEETESVDTDDEYVKKSDDETEGEDFFFFFLFSKTDESFLFRTVSLHTYTYIKKKNKLLNSFRIISSNVIEPPDISKTLDESKFNDSYNCLIFVMFIKVAGKDLSNPAKQSVRFDFIKKSRTTHLAIIENDTKGALSGFIKIFIQHFFHLFI